MPKTKSEGRTTTAAEPQDHKAGLPMIAFATAELFEQWIVARHDAPGLWLKFAKKASGLPTVTRDEAVDIALCHGWIDGQGASCDETYFLLRFTPRRPRSVWSQVNRARVERLMTEGRIAPRGLAQIEAAKSDGRWDAAYPPQSQGHVPDDVRAAFDASPEAAAAFEALSRSKRYTLLNGVATVKRTETRARKIAEMVARLSVRDDGDA